MMEVSQFWEFEISASGVVTCMSCVEVFATRIKIEYQAIKALFESRSRDQGHLQTVKIKGSRMQGYNLIYGQLKIKQSRASEGTIKRSSTIFGDKKSWSWSQTLQQVTYKWLSLVSLEDITPSYKWWSFMSICITEVKISALTLSLQASKASLYASIKEKATVNMPTTKFT